MNDICYILELVFKDEKGHYQSKYLYEYDMNEYALSDYQVPRGLMGLTAAKAKRAKIRKAFKHGYYKGLVDIKIKEVTLKIGDEVETDWTLQNGSCK